MKKLACLVALGVAMTTPALAEKMNLVGNAGDWTIFEHKKDCLTEKLYEDGTVIRIGLTEKGKKGYLATFNPVWDEFSKRHKYAMTYDLDGDSFDVEGHGAKKDDMPGVEIKFEDPQLLVDLALKHTMKLSVDGKDVAALDLTGSEEAVKQMLDCQALQ